MCDKHGFLDMYRLGRAMLADTRAEAERMGLRINTGGSMTSIREELKDAVEAALREKGYHPRTADYARATPAADAAIDTFFSEKLEEVEVCHAPGGHWMRMPGDVCWGRSNYSPRRTTALVRKAPEPEPVSIAREDAALLMEFVKDAPRHSPELDAAAGRVKKAIG